MITFRNTSDDRCMLLKLWVWKRRGYDIRCDELVTGWWRFVIRIDRNNVPPTGFRFIWSWTPTW